MTVSEAFSRVEALVFDVFGTVVDWRSSIALAVRAATITHGAAIDAEAFADAWRREGYVEALGTVRRGERPWTRVDDLHREKLRELLDRFGVRGLDESAIDHLNRAWHRLDPWPDSVAGLTRLRTRYIVSPLSNGDVALLTRMAKHAGLPWDCILAGELFTAYKPMPAVYDGAARLLDLPPERVMMVAAHTGDLRAARERGLRTAFVRRPTEYGPNRAADTPDADFDVIANDFIDLAARLDA
jgi:2-haloacid dehalogenase